MVVVTSVHRGTPGLAHEGSRDKQTKWPTHVDAATWPRIRVARRVTPWQPGADWLRPARHHRGGRGEVKIAAWADVSVWRGEGGAFHSHPV